MVLVLVAACLGPGASPAAAAPQTAATGDFLSAQTTVWEGRTQLIAFEVHEPAGEDRTLEVTSEDPGVASITRPCELVAGETLGWLRVRGETCGSTTLHAGGAELAVEVREPIEHARVHRPSARITAPAPGAVVWESFAVGVEVQAGHDEAMRRAPAVRLQLPNGATVEPSDILPLAHGPVRRLVFEVDLAQVPAGPFTFRALVTSPGGEVISSAPRTVTVAHPAEGMLVSGECEALVDTPRPEPYGESSPRVGGSPDASGGAFTTHFEADPALLLPVEVERDGRYQLILRARGDFGAGAFPSIGLGVDEPYQHQTSARVVARNWQRLAVGVPVVLAEGPHHLVLRFANQDPRRAQGRRNLFLDRYELYRLPDVNGRPIEASSGMAMMAMSMGDDRAEDGVGGGGSGGLRIAPERVVDGLPVSGRLQLKAQCLWPDPEVTEAPRVALLVNGLEVQAQQASMPVFSLDRSAFERGPNRLQMVATLEDGRRAATPVQVVHVDEPVGTLEPRELHRFDVVDERWGVGMSSMLELQDGWRRHHKVARFAPGKEAVLPLPSYFVGTFDVLFETRGQDYPDTSRFELFLRVDGEETRLAGADVAGWWTFHSAGQAKLPRGDKQLVVRLASGPECWLRALVLRGARSGEDRTPPRVEVLWPPAGHEVHGVDAVIARAADDEGVRVTDLLVDGRPQGAYGRLPHSGAGHVVLPLLLRDLAPGPHRLKVRVLDEAGNLGESAEVPFVVSEREPATPGSYARAVYLLDRFGYGAEPEQLAALLVRGEEEWLAEQLAAPAPGVHCALDLAEITVLEGGNFDTSRGVTAMALGTPKAPPPRSSACACAPALRRPRSAATSPTGAPRSQVAAALP